MCCEESSFLPIGSSAVGVFLLRSRFNVERLQCVLLGKHFGVLVGFMI